MNLHLVLNVAFDEVHRALACVTENRTASLGLHLWTPHATTCYMDSLHNTVACSELPANRNATWKAGSAPCVA